jgi:hypothetical protein
MTPTLTQEPDFPPAASPAFVEEISEKRNTTLMTFFGKEVMVCFIPRVGTVLMFF